MGRLPIPPTHIMGCLPVPPGGLIDAHMTMTSMSKTLLVLNIRAQESQHLWVCMATNRHPQGPNLWEPSLPFFLLIPSI
eukprot:12046736-Karenia_brevis.AAC.1